MLSIRDCFKALPILLLLAPAAHGGEFTLSPSIAVSEEYTDNVLDSSTDRVDDMITRVIPGVAMTYRSPAFTGDLSYLFDYRYYSQIDYDDTTAHFLRVNGKLTPVQNLFFIDLFEEYARVSLDITRDVTKESLFINQSDRNLATISPYFILRPGQRSTVKVGYRYVDTRYWDSDGIDKIDHVALLDMSHGLTEKFSLTSGYTFTHDESDIGDYDQHQAYGGFRYEYGERSYLFGQAGYTWTAYDTGRDFNKLFWDAGLSHVFDTVTASLSTGVKYEEDPLRTVMQNSFVVGTLEKPLKRGAVGLTGYFYEYVQTETDETDTRKYGGTIYGRHDLTAKLNGRLAVTLENYEQPLTVLQGDTRRLFVDAGFSYLLAEKLTVSLAYIFTEYDSKEIPEDNKHINRAIIEIKKTF